jgi:serpin B
VVTGGLAAAIHGTVPTETAAASAGASAGVNAFGVDFYRQLAAQPGNIVFSPANVSAAFTMALLGARGETRAQIARAFHMPVDGHGALAEPDLQALAGRSEGVELSAANSVWLQTGFDVNASYARSLERLGSAFQHVDFIARPSAAPKAINDWVEAKTAGTIHDLVTDDLVGPVVLVSALHMIADWDTPFLAAQTAAGDFHAPQGTVRGLFMNARMRLQHMAGDGFDAIALPYRGDRLRMAVFLPKPPHGLARFEQRLGRLAGELARLDAAPAVPVDVVLPKHRLESAIDLEEPLQRLGITLAFGSHADFSGVAPAALYIRTARTMAFLSVDERGTEAAAATAVELASSARTIRPSPVLFRADHPFVFVVQDRKTQAIQFMGRLSSPDQTPLSG